jgi:hypothetical protein
MLREHQGAGQTLRPACEADPDAFTPAKIATDDSAGVSWVVHGDQ